MKEAVMADIKSAPERISKLEQRVAALERHLGGNWPADVCRACGEQALRLDSSYIGDPNVEEHWKCSSCDKTEIRVVRPRKATR